MSELNKLFKEMYSDIPSRKKQKLSQKLRTAVKRVAFRITSLPLRISRRLAWAYESIVVALRSFKANKRSLSFKLGPCNTLGDTEAYITDIDESGRLYGKYYYYSWGGAYDDWYEATWEPNGELLFEDGTVWEKYSLKSNK